MESAGGVVDGVSVLAVEGVVAPVVLPLGREVEGVSTRHTLSRAIQVLPQGFPLRQFFWASTVPTAATLRARRRRDQRMALPPLLVQDTCAGRRRQIGNSWFVSDGGRHFGHSLAVL
jgi:hypothetical protein